MMITALAAVARAKKAAEAPLSRCSEKLFFFDGTFGKRKRREERKKREGACSTSKGGLPSLPPSLASSPPLFSTAAFVIVLVPTKAALFNRKSKDLYMLHGTQRGGGEEGSKHADSASLPPSLLTLPPPFRFAGEGRELWKE